MSQGPPREAIDFTVLDKSNRRSQPRSAAVGRAPFGMICSRNSLSAHSGFVPLIETLLMTVTCHEQYELAAEFQHSRDT